MIVLNCSRCGTIVQEGAKFCSKCGNSLKASPQERRGQVFEQRATTPDSKEITPGEVVLKDTGLFPITYLKHSTNGKLTLTNRRLLFKAGKLQPMGGVYVPGGIFIPNPKDAKKSEEYLSIPLADIASVDHGCAKLTVHVAGEEHVFGGMQQTKEWADAIINAMGPASGQ